MGTPSQVHPNPMSGSPAELDELSHFLQEARQLLKYSQALKSTSAANSPASKRASSSQIGSPSAKRSKVEAKPEDMALTRDGSGQASVHTLQLQHTHIHRYIDTYT